jgi:hypothetical protein
LPGNYEGEEVHGILGIVAFFLAGGILPLATIEARPPERALIKVPFAFVIGDKIPALTRLSSRISMLAKAKPPA